MDDRPRFTVLAGSLRTDSLNRAAADFAAAHLSVKGKVECPDLAPVPLFNEDLELSGDPSPVQNLKQAVVSSQAILIFTPEYNSGVPALTKNAIDWLSRPYGAGCLIDRVVAIACVGPSSRGGENVREHLLQTCTGLTERVYPLTLGVPNVFELESGRLPAIAEASIKAWLDEFFTFSRKWFPETN
ncbi:MAG: NADPH-dependent FMN reductase [Actinomycetota bacterium]|nr:NADPH-dependent FMN reductase [Actinomycetota bacterium]|tara:strand:+ start:5543 stop:6100 length:558 start_codon:yes stop_codon:yes gene_type:complete